jgi:hypothetical protein
MRNKFAAIFILGFSLFSTANAVADNRGLNTYVLYSYATYTSTDGETIEGLFQCIMTLQANGSYESKNGYPIQGEQIRSNCLLVDANTSPVMAKDSNGNLNFTFRSPGNESYDVQCAGLRLAAMSCILKAATPIYPPAPIIIRPPGQPEDLPVNHCPPYSTPSSGDGGEGCIPVGGTGG